MGELEQDSEQTQDGQDMVWLQADLERIESNLRTIKHAVIYFVVIVTLAVVVSVLNVVLK